MTLELNGIKYLLVEEVLTVKNNKSLEEKRRKHNGIYQGVKEISKSGFLKSGFIIVKVLIPEENIVEYNLDLLESDSNKPKPIPKTVLDKIICSIHTIIH